MVILVRAGVVELLEPDDFKGFKVVVEGDDAEPLSAVGTLADRDTAWIREQAVRELAARHASAGWDEGFAAMLAYARTKGWVDDDQHRIQAHVEWEPRS